MKAFRYVVVCFYVAAVGACSAPETEQKAGIDAATRAALSDYIYIHGGYYDGAAAGQETSFLVTPDDRLRCEFVSDHPFLPGYEPTPPAIDIYDEVVPGIYERLLGAIGRPERPGPASEKEEDQRNFVIEFAEGNKKSWTALEIGEPGFDRLADFFQDVPHRCWLFG